MGPRSTSKSTDPLERPSSDKSEEGLVVGFVHAPHGLDGELRVESRTDVPDRFRVGETLECDGVGQLTITGFRLGPKGPLLRFKGVVGRTGADRLRGRYLRVSVAEARRAARGNFLWADLIGLRAESQSGYAIGKVREVLRAGETDVLVIQCPGVEDLLLPMIDSVVQRIDISAGFIVVKPQEELS